MRMGSYLEDELAHWPTVKHELTHRGRHRAFVLTYGHHKRTLFHSGTGVERRAILNSVTLLRRLMREMGATRDDEK